MRKTKVLGLALVAMLSMGAVTAVSASGDTLTANSYPTVLTGTAEVGFTDEFVTTAGVIRCPDISYDATIASPVATAGSLAVTPTFPHTSCTAFGFPSTIDTNGCTYVFRVLAGTAGDVDLECPAGQEMTVTAIASGIVKCTCHIKPQTDIGGTVTYANTASGGTVQASLTGIDYTHTQGMGVGSCPSGSATTGTVVFKAIFQAETEPGGSPNGILFS